jgi:hypothetical protein
MTTYEIKINHVNQGHKGPVTVCEICGTKFNQQQVREDAAKKKAAK